MNESGYTAAVNRKLRPHIYVWKIMNSMQNGIPDCWYSGTKAGLFAEYKYIKNLPKRETTILKLDLSELQTKWLTERYSEGRNVCVILGSPQGAFIFTDQKWNDLEITKSDLIMNQKQVAQWILNQTNQ